jgi:hypothetical protein
VGMGGRAGVEVSDWDWMRVLMTSM